MKHFDINSIIIEVFKTDLEETLQKHNFRNNAGIIINSSPKYKCNKVVNE
jgi:hypothetical protein